MTKPERVLPDLTDAEEAATQAGIAADVDNPEITDAQASELRPLANAMPTLFMALKRGRGRPSSGVTKVPVKLRIDPATLATFKAAGRGWQTRMNEALRREAARIEKGE